MAICRFCEINVACVDAHIIPRSFFTKYSLPNTVIKMVGVAKNSYPKRIPIGPYDKNILCADCEAIFSDYDDYGYKFFHTEDNWGELYSGTEDVVKIARKFDYIRLKLFILSMLWRSSVSENIFYKQVKLGKYENEIRKLIIEKDPGQPQSFPILFQRFEYQSNLIPMLCPARMHLFERNFYQYMLNGFLVQIKVDNQGLPAPFPDLVLSPDEPLIVIPKEYKGSREHHILLRAAKNIQKI
jgi:hypothetical protein